MSLKPETSLSIAMEMPFKINSSEHEPLVPYWLEILLKLLQWQHAQPAVISVSVLWTSFRLLGNLPDHSSSHRTHGSNGSRSLEILGNVLRGAALISCTIASRHGKGQGFHWAAVAYVALLGFIRQHMVIRGRHLLLRQMVIISSYTLMAMATADVLPLLVVGTPYHPNSMALASAFFLFLSLCVFAASPREWMQHEAFPAPPDFDKMRPSKEETCSWLDYWCTFSRMDGVMRKSALGYLSMRELEDLPWSYSPEILRAQIESIRQRHKTTARTLLMLLWPDLCYSAIFAALFFLWELAVPFGLYQLLEDLEHPAKVVLQPYVWLLLMFGGRLFGSIMQQQVAFNTGRAAIKLKTALTAELYHRVMSSRELTPDSDNCSKSQSSDSQEKASMGQLANLISTDIKTLVDARILVMAIFGGLVGCGLGVAGLYAVVGWPCIVGLAVMALGSPITARIMKYVEFQEEAFKYAQDVRISLASEYLRSINIIKYFGWEDSVVGLFTKARNKEQKHLWTIALLSAIITEIAYCIPTISFLAILGLHVGVAKQPLTPSVAYTTSSLLEIIRDNFAMISPIAMHITKMTVSFKRLDDFVLATEPREVYPEGPLRMTGAAFRRHKAARFRLENVSIDFVQGGLNVITGQSGSGKTTLLLAILCETVKEAGSVTRPKDAEYVAQSPWLQAQSVRESILSNSPYDADRYRNVVKACCLDYDLDELSEGDNTDVGENGSALSGGQRVRVALARAIYSPTSLLLWDDIFSAIDTKTSITLWNRIFCTDLLKDRTVVLVAQLSWVSAEADLVVELQNGQVKSAERNAGAFRNPKMIELDVGLKQEPSDCGYRSPPVHHTALSEAAKHQTDTYTTEAMEVDEEVSSTAVSSRFTVIDYMCHFGGPVAVSLAVATLLLYNCTELAAYFWMSLWVDKADQNSTDSNTAFYLGTYVAISLGSTSTEGIAFLLFTRGSLMVANQLHSQLASAVMNVSLSWFQENPVGRIINRLSEDMGSLDRNVAEPLMEFFDQVMKASLTVGAITSILPAFIVPVVILSVTGAVMGEYYSCSIVAIKRLASSSQSPIQSHFSQSLEGLTVIRARSDRPLFFTDKLNRLLYASAKATATQRDCDQWLKFRINTLAALISVAGGVLALSQRTSMSVGLVAFSLSRASEMSQAVLRLVFKMSDLNVEMQAFHRVAEYCNLVAEEQLIGEQEKVALATSGDVANDLAHDDWPQRGQIEFRNLTVRYHPDGPDVLKDITLTFNAGERVAIVGRTGSGKSTLLLSLLRFTHIVSGQILYAGVDISNIPRKRLRQAVALIPQEALLFEGSIASNLDPSKSIPKPVLQRALDTCATVLALTQDTAGIRSSKLIAGSADPVADTESSIKARFEHHLKLSTPVSAGGSNFSHGQRQVLSLCRMLVRKSKVMLLDEATSSMDPTTDASIQRVLRDELSCVDSKDRCLVTVAHRLRTIADYDKVVVIGFGKVIEVGTPRQLLGKRGHFYEMVKHSGEESLFIEDRYIE